MSVPEQREQREVGGRQRQHRLCYIARIHRARPFPLSGPSVKSGAVQTSKHRSAPGKMPRTRSAKNRMSRENSGPVTVRTTKSPRNLAKLGRRTLLLAALTSLIVVKDGLPPVPSAARGGQRQAIEQSRASRLCPLDGQKPQFGLDAAGR